MILANLLEANSAGQPAGQTGEVWSDEDRKIIEEKLLYIMDNPRGAKKWYAKTATYKSNHKDYEIKEFLLPQAKKVSLNFF